MGGQILVNDINYLRNIDTRPSLLFVLHKQKHDFDDKRNHTTITLIVETTIEEIQLRFQTWNIALDDYTFLV